ncbi:MAG TPA: TIGR03435 family protein [Bryobacteraceae bacterium]|nr:TIGR03435 family protein [Bryobacteraceae bacterium]
MSYFCSIWIAAVLGGGALAQSASFEAASVKVSATQTGRGSMRGGPGTADPGQITFTNVTLFNVLLRAYDLQSFQLSAPDWLSTRRYDIAAKVPPGASKDEGNRMLQSLLAERFRMEVHRETRELQGFELVAGRNGSKLKAAVDAGPGAPADESGPPKTGADGYPILNGPGLVFMEGVSGRSVVTFLTARAQPLSALVQLLTREFRMPILDKTGLDGKFDFKLEFAPQAPGALPAEPTDDSAANLTTAVQQQLGLRLSPAKVASVMVVVDRANPVPTEN